MNSLFSVNYNVFSERCLLVENMKLGFNDYLMLVYSVYSNTFLKCHNTETLKHIVYSAPAPPHTYTHLDAVCLLFLNGKGLYSTIQYRPFCKTQYSTLLFCVNYITNFLATILKCVSLASLLDPLRQMCDWVDKKTNQVHPRI